MMTGIYSITNKINGKKYIGSALNVIRRWDKHRCDLKKNKHHSHHLQRSYDKHGIDNFEFEILFTCLRTDLLRLEQYCINNYQPEYNNAKIAGNCLGVKHTKDSSDKKRIANIGRIFSEESLAKMKIAAKKRGISEETKHKMNLAKKGRQMLSKCKRIVQIDIVTGIEIREFNSSSEASLILNINRPGIIAVLKNRALTCGGFKWKYK